MTGTATKPAEPSEPTEPVGPLETGEPDAAAALTSEPEPVPAVRSTDWTLRRRLRNTFVVVGVIISVLVGGVIASAILFIRSGNDVIYKWQPAVVVSERLLTDVIDQETGVRGYALSRDSAFLAPYDQKLAKGRTDAARVEQLIGDEPETMQRFRAFEAAIKKWQDEIADPAVTAIRVGDPAGVRLAGSVRGKELFDALRARFAEHVDVLIQQTRDARDLRGVLGVVFAVAGGLLIVIVFACGFVLRRGLDLWVLAPMSSLGAQTRTVAAGDTHREIAPAGPQELVALGQDVEAMRLQIAGELARAEAISEELRLRGEELARSNEDLQQFAYVASHDLSEPLRKVANFCQLLERQYGPQLDDRAKQYIDFAVDGAKRMQALITDLLALSRVGRTTEQFVSVDLDVAFDYAVQNLGTKVPGDAQVKRLTPLPAVSGDRSLLTSLLENLVGNAIKYRREDVPPKVEVRADLNPDEGRWEITVSDNGIGIDSQYADRIFAVFQRLHLRDAYGGTGIGLALCRKIVEFHGGKIWLVTVESASAEAGATFRFTLPEGTSHAKPRH